MGHLQDMTPEQRSKFISWSHKRKLEEMRGHHYSWWNEEKFKDWKVLYKYTTTSEEQAKKWRDELKPLHKKVKIVCGYEQIVQRIKHYTIIVK